MDTTNEDNTAVVAKQVKQAVKKYVSGKLAVQSKGGKTRFIMVRADKIDNKLRKMILDIEAPTANVRDKNDISYGNISDRIISASVDVWVKALGLKEDTNMRSFTQFTEERTFKKGDRVVGRRGNFEGEEAKVVKYDWRLGELTIAVAGKKVRVTPSDWNKIRESFSLDESESVELDESLVLASDNLNIVKKTAQKLAKQSPDLTYYVVKHNERYMKGMKYAYYEVYQSVDMHLVRNKAKKIAGYGAKVDMRESVELGEAKDYRVELEKRHIKALTIIRHIDKILGKQGKWTDSFGEYVTAKLPKDVDTSTDRGWEYQQNRGRGDWSFTIEPKDVVKYNYEGKAKIKKSGSMKIGEFTKFISKIWAKLNQKGLSSERPMGESVELDEINMTKMGELHKYIKAGKPAEQIAKVMKLDVNTIRALMKGHKESVELDEKSGWQGSGGFSGMTFEFPDERKAKQFHLDIENSAIGTGDRVGNKVKVTDVDLKYRAAVKKSMTKNRGKLMSESNDMREDYKKMMKWYETSNEKKVYAILDKNKINLPAEGFTLVQNMLKKHRDNVKKAADEIMNKHYPHQKESVELDEKVMGAAYPKGHPMRKFETPASPEMKKHIESGKAKILLNVQSVLGPTTRFVVIVNPKFRNAKVSGQDKVLMATISDPKRGRIKMFAFHGSHVSHQKAMQFAKNNKLVAKEDEKGNPLYAKESVEHEDTKPDMSKPIEATVDEIVARAAEAIGRGKAFGGWTDSVEKVKNDITADEDSPDSPEV